MYGKERNQIGIGHRYYAENLYKDTQIIGTITIGFFMVRGLLLHVIQ